MSSWVLLVLVMAFSFLAYDASKLAEPNLEVPYSVTAETLGQEINHVPLHEQAKLKSWNLRQGLGDLNQSFWLWMILAVASAAAFVIDLLK